MNVKALIGVCLLCCAVLVVARSATPQEEGGEAPAMDMEAMMAAMALAQPGPEHEELAKLAGEWESQMSLQMMPGAPPTESTAKAAARMILGGRFLEVTTHGAFMGMEVESRALIGFDRRHEEYTIIGLDTLGTYWVTGKGKRGEDGVIRMRGEDDDPMGKQVYTFEYEILGEDEYMFRVVFESLGPQTFDPPHAMVTVRNKRKK